MRALITGGRGFAGRHLEAHLRERGDVVVVAECDVTDDAATADAVRTTLPDAIYHLAALSSVAGSWLHPAAYTRVNVLGTLHVLNAAGAYAPLATTLVVSSADVYGVVREDDLPLVETHVTAPVSPYAQSKLEAEGFALRRAREGQRVVVVRAFPHIGPGQSERFVVPALTRRLLEARANASDTIVVGDLSARRDFTDVRDVARAYRLLVEHAVSGEVYHVASGQDVALSRIADELAADLDLAVRFEVDPALLRPVEVPVLRGSFTKLHEVTGWEPTISLSQSLRDVIRDMEDRTTEESTS
jgi:GDP-4-dehydro-6-deoxy-D-mannose reductase